MERTIVTLQVANQTHRRYPARHMRLVCLSLFALSILLSGCSFLDVKRVETVRGALIEIDHTIDFFLKTGARTHKNLSSVDIKDLEAIVLAEPSWSLSDGLVSEQSDLALVFKKVKWTEGDTKYTADGLGLVVKARVRVAENAQVGEKAVIVRLPGLEALATYVGATPTFPNSGSFIEPDKVVVQNIRVHGSALASLVATVGKWVMIGIIIIALIGLVIWLDSKFRR
jgi:hypothetical protein